MKQYIILFTTLCFACVWSSCSTNDDVEQQSSMIELKSPENGVSINLSDVSEIIFSWGVAQGTSVYTLMFSKEQNLSSPCTIAIEGNRIVLQPEELDAKLSEIGIDYGSTTAVYWTVKPADLSAYTEVRTFTATRLPLPIVVADAPADNATFDLGKLDGVSFSWTTDIPASKFTVAFSKSQDMSSAKSIQAETSPYVTSAEALDAVIAEMGVAAGSAQKIYWTVKPGVSEQPTRWTRAVTITRIAGAAVNINLTAPANGATVQLEQSTKDNTVTFSWSAAPSTIGTAPYSVVFSKNADMSNAVSINNIAGTSKAITQFDLQDAIFTNASQLGLKRFKENTVYWKVKVDGRLSSGTANTLKLTGMKIFKDVRGSEINTYDVAILTYTDGSEVTWLAHNLRTTKYPNGDDLDERFYLFPPTYANDPTSSFLQEPTVGVYYHASQLDLKDAIVPKGWKLPTWDDLCKLYQAAAEAYPHQTPWPMDPANTYRDVVALKDPVYATDLVGNPDLNKWKMNMRPTRRYIWQIMWHSTEGSDTYPAAWFYVYDNTLSPHGTMGNGAAASGSGYAQNFGATPENIHASEGSSAPVRLIYTGE